MLTTSRYDKLSEFIKQKNTNSAIDAVYLNIAYFTLFQIYIN